MEGGRWGFGLDGRQAIKEGTVVRSTGCLYVSDEPLNYNPETNIALCSLTRIEIEIWKEKKKIQAGDRKDWEA